MDRNLVLNLLKKGEKTSEDISKEINLPLAKTRIFLLRLMEEGKIIRNQKNKQWFWSLTETKDLDLKFDKYRQTT